MYPKLSGESNIEYNIYKIIVFLIQKAEKLRGELLSKTIQKNNVRDDRNRHEQGYNGITGVVDKLKISSNSDNVVNQW